MPSVLMKVMTRTMKIMARMWTYTDFLLGTWKPFLGTLLTTFNSLLSIVKIMLHRAHQLWCQTLELGELWGPFRTHRNEMTPYTCLHRRLAKHYRIIMPKLPRYISERKNWVRMENDPAVKDFHAIMSHPERKRS